MKGWVEVRGRDVLGTISEEAGDIREINIIHRYKIVKNKFKSKMYHFNLYVNA